MHPLIIQRIATTTVLPLVAAGGWAGYAHYTPVQYPYQPPALACTVLSVDVRPGSTAGEIAMLQRFLGAEGYLQVNATGYFGQSTYIALTRFQADHGLPITGIADAGTRAVLQQMSCGTAYPVQQPVAYTYPQPTYPSQNAYTYPQSYPYQNAYPNQYSYQPPQASAYPPGCHYFYDRACYVNGRYVGPGDGSTYDGPGDACYSFQNNGSATCGIAASAATYGNGYPSAYASSYASPSYSYASAGGYYSAPYQSNQYYGAPADCSYDRPCSASFAGRSY